MDEEEDILDEKDNPGRIINFNKEINNQSFSEKAYIKAKGIRVNLVRKSVNLNLKEFGELCKVESGMLGRYERGSTAIHITCIFKICISLRDKFNLFVDPEWIENGTGYGPHIINEGTTTYLKDVDDLIKQYTACYDDGKSSLNYHSITNKDNIFNGNYVTIGQLIDLNNPKDLYQLSYVEADIKLKKAFKELDDQLNIVGKISYDEEANQFIINNKKDGLTPVCLEKKDIESIKVLNGFALCEKPINLKNIN